MKAARPKSEPEFNGLQLFLRVKHPRIDPHEITRTLGLEPEETIAAGASISDTGVRRLHSESYWIAQLATPSLAELAARYRAQPMSMEPMFGSEDFASLRDASDLDVRILIQLRRVQPHAAFLRTIINEGGSITMLVDRGEEPTPAVIRRALPKLAELGIGLEIG